MGLLTELRKALAGDPPKPSGAAAVGRIVAQAILVNPGSFERADVARDRLEQIKNYLAENPDCSEKKLAEFRLEVRDHALHLHKMDLITEAEHNQILAGMGM